jgi:hypothetical protein
MVVVFYGILSGLPKRGERARRRIAYLLLPGLTVLWTNLHGGFVAGIGMMVVFGVAEWAPALWSTDARQSCERWHLGRLYLGGAAACLAASLMNPYFYHLHAHILQYLNDPYQFDHISEFLSLSFHHPAARYLEPMLLLGAVAAYRQVRRGRLADALILVGWGHLALVSARHIPLFVALAAPAVAAMLAEWQEAWTRAPVAPWVAKAARRMQMLAQETEYHEMPWRAHLVSAAALLALAAGLYAPAPAVNFRSDYDPAIYPAKAVAHLAALPDSGRVFTHDEWGDYLIYRLYPRTKVFLDGRSDFYGRTFGEKYLDVMNVKRGWEAILARYSIDTILLPPDAPLAGALKESPRWRIDYDDGVALVFRAAPRDPAGNSQVSTACKGDGEARGRETARTTM